MPRTKSTISTSTNSKPLRPALTPEARESQLISLAMDLVEERLRNGTASSQETTHFLKLATVNYQLEKRKLETDITLSEAKVKTMESQQHSEELYSKALEAMRSYGGGNSDESNNNE